MPDNLISFENKDIVYNKNLILKVLLYGIKFGSKSDISLFCFYFFELYKSPIFVPLLNTILTKIQKKQACFKLTPLKSWDRIVGHCSTTIKKENGEENSFKNNIFSKHYIIVIKKISPDIIIHEIAHAIEHESKIDLNNGFKDTISLDFKENKTSLLSLKLCIKDVMQEQLKNYKIKYYMSEIFARFFELIALSKEIIDLPNYQYKYNDIIFYFSNTIEYLENSLFPVLNKKIDNNILKQSFNIINSFKTNNNKWTNKFSSKFENLTENDKIYQQLFDDADGKKMNLAIAVRTEFDKYNKNKLEDGTSYIEFGCNNKLLQNDEEKILLKKIEN